MKWGDKIRRKAVGEIIAGSCQQSRGSHRLVVEVGRAQQGASLLFLAASCHPRLLPPLSHRFPPAARAKSELGITG